MEIESLYVGRPPMVENIPWYEYPELQANPAQFVAAVEAVMGREAGDKMRPIFLICRSGKRSLKAAQWLRSQGFAQVRHVHGGLALRPVSVSTALTQSPAGKIAHSTAA